MIIKHGLVVDPASGLSEHMDILVKNGKIARIAPEISEDSEEILEAGGLVVGPGLIDTHVHFRDPGFTYKEDIHTGAKASATFSVQPLPLSELNAFTVSCHLS